MNGSADLKQPTVRQYFHKGLLWRASERTEVASFELFVDLLYVGILAINGDHAAEDPTGHELLRFSITFIMSWKLWSDLALIISWFETDDILQRLSVMTIMACLLGWVSSPNKSFGKITTDN
jgi:low temperature requirement protein LtrA